MTEPLQALARRRRRSTLKLPPSVRVAWDYAEDVLNDKVPAGELVKLACQRHFNDWTHQKERGLWFDRVSADRALRFFPKVLRHSTGEWAGKPVTLAPWQAFRIASIFGWRRHGSDLRRFRHGYNAVARKNGKTTEAAGVGLYMLTSDGEAGAEIYSYATKADQARIVWNEAKRMIRKAPDLAMRLKPVHSRISYVAKESWWAPLSRDNESMDGLNPHLAIADELHAHKTRDAYDVMESAFGSRREPLHWVITTRGANQLNICGELDDYSTSVLRGDVHDDSWFAYIACLDETDAWDDEEAWAKANPNLNISVRIDKLREEMAHARHQPGSQNEFKRKRCNLWTESVERWMPEHVWRQCAVSVDDEELVGKPSWWALDLSSSQDLTALVGIYDLGEERLAVRCRFWLPEKDLEQRERQDRSHYLLWKQQGLLETTPGPTVNLRIVADAFAQAISQPGAVAGAYDRYKIKEVLSHLEELGLRHHVADVDTHGNVRVKPGQGPPVVPIGQGFKDMGAAERETMRLATEGKLLHGRNPLLTMCVANAVVEVDPGDNRKFVKKRAIGRIDGTVALAMACLCRARLPADGQTSVYETRGLFLL